MSRSAGLDPLNVELMKEIIREEQAPRCVHHLQHSHHV